ncbi:MAG: AraC family transcriptional regulator [Yoonia sp.]
MQLATEFHPTALQVATIRSVAATMRWRTEAMRSHATPRLIYITKGQGRITVAGLTSGYGPNNLIYVPAHTMYGYEAGPTVFGHMITIPAAMASEWPEVAVHLRMRDVALQKEWSHMVEALEKELATVGQSHSRAAHYHLGLLAVFFDRLTENSPADTHQERRRTSAARLVAAYTDLIERDYRKEHGISEYATALGVTATHLTRCCNQTCGKSALALLRDRVNYEACVLLRDTKTPVNQIADQLGFTSAAYFTRSFAAQTGTTPSVFRKQSAALQH